MPLEVCKALTIHKSQGMNIGEGKQFEKVVVCLPVSRNTCPGLELVATSGAVELADFAIGNSSTQLTKQYRICSILGRLLHIRLAETF